MAHPYQFTLNLLQNLIESAPVTFLKTRKNEMARIFETLAEDATVPRKQIEDTIISFGKEIWPYREAYQAIYNEYGRAQEEGELKKLLSEELKPKYEKFLKEKGNIETVRGAGLNLDLSFTPDERAEIVKAELVAHDKIHSYLEKLLSGEKQEEYFRALEKYQAEQKKIEEKIAQLRALAEKSPKWRAEILDKARVFDEGFGYLERPVSLQDVGGEIDYYLGVLGIEEE